MLLEIGTIIKTTNSGVNWFALNSGVNYELIQFVFRNEIRICMQVINGTILKTTNGGD